MKALLNILITFTATLIQAQTTGLKDVSAFVPKGYVLFDTIYGDLNKDGLKDCILVIKGTDKANFVQDEYRGTLDRNRRGIIVLFRKNDYYETAVKNYTCFSSENEEGGVYFPPELYVEIKKGILCVNYSHGRYGYWEYKFRFQNGDFELIGYDSTDGAVIINADKSINFLTKKKLERVNTNNESEGGDEIFKETWSKVNISKLIKLSEIKDFDELDMSVY